jgi:hypothetical protein
LALIDRTEKYVICTSLIYHFHYLPSSPIFPFFTFDANITVGVCLLATLIFWWSVYNYLPSHIAYLARRLSYYIHGDENAAIFGAVLAGWWGVVKRELGLVGRLYKGVWDSRFGWENTMENGKVDL